MSTFLLAEAFPGLARLPRAGIAKLPTPSQIVRYVSDAGMLALFVKREDQSSPVYGGNKVRKLDLLLGQALAENRRAVLTLGAYGSNHALATSIHARQLGLEPHAILTPQVPTPYAEETLRAHAAVGTCLHIAEDEAAAGRIALSLAEELLGRDGSAPYIIPAGGSAPLGVIGYVNAAYELMEQAKSFARDTLGGIPRLVERTIGFGELYVAAGSLGTAIGLAIGLQSLGRPYRVTAVRAIPGPQQKVDESAEDLVRETVALLRSYDPRFPEICFEDLCLSFSDEALGDHYALPTPMVTKAVDAARAVGLSLETTYSGKAFAVLDAHLTSKRVDQETVLFMDTYNSAPLPVGPLDMLPAPLQEYVFECRELYGGSGVLGA